MSLHDCKECWSNPCTCGYDYRKWSVADLKRQIEMLEKVLEAAEERERKKTESKIT